MNKKQKTLIMTESELRAVVRDVLGESQSQDTARLGPKAQKVISALGSSILNLRFTTLADTEENFEDVLLGTQRALPGPLRLELQNLIDSNHDLVGAAWQNAQSRGASRERVQGDYGPEPRKMPKYFGYPEDPRSSM